MRFIVVLLTIHTLATNVLTGLAITVVLSAGMAGLKPILIAVAAGFGLSIPVSWFVTRQFMAKAAIG